MSEQRAGIVAAGCYIPATRLPLALVQGGQAGEGSEGGPEKAVAGFDEDSITMAVAACINCLGARERSAVDGLYFASTTSPFREKQGASFIAKALDLRDDVATIDFGGTLRAGAGALLAAANAVRANPGQLILVVAADSRLAAPRSALEMNVGDAAAAFLVGAGEVMAVFEHTYCVSNEIYDVWRGQDDAYVRTWEDRFNVLHGYNENIRAVLDGFLENSGTAVSDYQRVALYGPDARSLAGAARAAGISAPVLQDSLFGRVGNSGAAFTPLLLAAALEDAREGERVLAVFYGDGAEALSLHMVSDGAVPERGLHWHLGRGRPLHAYDSYLQSRHLDAREHDRRAGEGVPATVHYRERDADISFLAQRCTQCGTVHFPACRVCYGCYTKDSFESERLSDLGGRVMSFTLDYFFPSPEPPLVAGVCEVDNGARVYLQMAEADADELRCDLPVEFVFRKIHDAGKRPNYFWKSRPLRQLSDTGASA